MTHDRSAIAVTGTALAPGGRRSWLGSLLSSHRAAMAEAERRRVVKHARPLGRYEALFYQSIAAGGALLFALLPLGARS